VYITITSIPVPSGLTLRAEAHLVGLSTAHVLLGCLPTFPLSYAAAQLENNCRAAVSKFCTLIFILVL